MERSLPSILDSERNFGLLFKNHYLDKRMTASAGIFAVTGSDGEFFSRDRDFDTAALNWHLYSNVRLQFNYIFADVSDTGDVLSNASGHIHAFQSRVQVEF